MVEYDVEFQDSDYIGCDRWLSSHCRRGFFSSTNSVRRRFAPAGFRWLGRATLWWRFRRRFAAAGVWQQARRLGRASLWRRLRRGFARARLWRRGGRGVGGGRLWGGV